MPAIVGLVQRMFIDDGAQEACVWVGTTIADVTLLRTGRTPGDPPHTGAYRSSQVDALAHALTARRELEITFDPSSRIISFTIR